MSEDQLNNNMAMPIDGRESLEMVKTVGTGGDFVVFTRLVMVMVMVMVMVSYKDHW